ncbi:MAG: amidohydrolase family protein [Sulfolobaceae archaeon]|nr:amidohydrolase family protein [Sulfolobaceae archaeon]
MVEEVDLVVVGGKIISSASNIIDDGAIAVKGGKIIDIGKVDKILDKYKALEILDRKDSIVLPAFVDCHVHTQQYFLRSVINDKLLPMPPLWTEVLIPFEKKLSREEAYYSSLFSLMKMIKNGVAYFLEAGAPYPDELYNALNTLKASGIITMATYNVYKGEKYDHKQILNETERLLKNYGKDVVWCSIRQIMMASKELIEGLVELCEKDNTGITYHLGEYQGEVDFSLTNYGKRPLEAVDSLGVTKIKPTVIAHGVYLSDTEQELAKNRGISVSWSPTSDSILMGNHWLSFNAHRVNFCIGSDGGALSTLDLLVEAKIARSVGKALSVGLVYDKSTPTSTELFSALTENAGIALNKKIGKLEPGYIANMITINPENILPAIDVIEGIISFATGNDVRDVIVEGKIVLKDRKFVTINEQEVYEKVNDSIVPSIKDKVLELIK